MDWSMNIPKAPVSSSLHVPPASKHVSSSQVSLHNIGSNGKNRAESAALSVLDYSEGQLVTSNSWDGAYHVLSIFRSEDT